MTLYMALTRPILVYGNVVYGPYYQADRNTLESVQYIVIETQACMVQNCSLLSYVVKIAFLGLPTLV